ncbi:MAG: aryl-sulfate sulfotransferase [Flavobacteriales bacterium]
MRTLEQPGRGGLDPRECSELDTDGNILVLLRYFNEITKIDRTDGSIIWRMGGVQNEFTFVDDPGFFLQHDIRRMPNGNITLFDNSKPGAHPGRGVEYAIDETAMTATPVWSGNYMKGAYSRAMGSMQRLENGNSLIGWGALTPDNAMFTVHDPDGERIARLTFLDTSVTYRAYYFDELPFSIERPLITCSAVGDAFELTATATGNTYIWSNGASGPSITVGALDTVYVEVPVGSGGFLRSAPFTPDVDCLGTSIGEVDARSFTIHPNPASALLYLQLNEVVGAVKVEILDALGKVVSSSTTISDRTTISVGALLPGVYLVRVAGKVQRFVKIEGS